MADELSELGAKSPGPLAVSVESLHMLLANVEAREIFHTPKLLLHLAAYASQVILVETDRSTTLLDCIFLG